MGSAMQIDVVLVGGYVSDLLPKVVLLGERRHMVMWLPILSFAGIFVLFSRHQAKCQYRLWQSLLNVARVGQNLVNVARCGPIFVIFQRKEYCFQKKRERD